MCYAFDFWNRGYILELKQKLIDLSINYSTITDILGVAFPPDKRLR